MLMWFRVRKLNIQRIEDIAYIRAVMFLVYVWSCMEQFFMMVDMICLSYSLYYYPLTSRSSSLIYSFDIHSQLFRTTCPFLISFYLSQFLYELRL